MMTGCEASPWLPTLISGVLSSHYPENIALGYFDSTTYRGACRLTFALAGKVEQDHDLSATSAPSRPDLMSKLTSVRLSSNPLPFQS